jgi:flagellar M-ring protein FliF
MINNDIAEESIQKIKETVQAAIGFNSERGDIVTVTGLSFDQSLKEEMSQLEEFQEAAVKRKTYIYAGLIALVLIFLMILFFIFRRLPSRIEDKEIKSGNVLDYMVNEEEFEEVAVSKLSTEEKKRQKYKKEITKLVSDKPEEISQILKSWLMED